MAGNTRGKLKEQFEGIHRNFDWSRRHCIEALVLIAEHKPELAIAVRSIGKAIDTLDKLLMDVYSKL